MSTETDRAINLAGPTTRPRPELAQMTRDNRILENLAAADGALMRVHNDSHNGSVVALDDGSCFSISDIYELTLARDTIRLVLQAAEARQALAEQRRARERGEQK